jgi:hypothetical protein
VVWLVCSGENSSEEQRAKPGAVTLSAKREKKNGNPDEDAVENQTDPLGLAGRPFLTPFLIFC